MLPDQQEVTRDKTITSLAHEGAFKKVLGESGPLRKAAPRKRPIEGTRENSKMPFTAEQKREHRAQQALAKGQAYKPRFQKAPQACPALRTQQEARPTAPAASSGEVLTVEEEMNRARMEAEDNRERMVQMMRTSDALRTYYTNWMHLGQIVDIKPVCRRILGIPANEHYIRYKLARQNVRTGFWTLEATKGPNKGKYLWIDLPKEFLC